MSNAHSLSWRRGIESTQRNHFIGVNNKTYNHNSSHHTAAGLLWMSHTKPVGRALLFEHLPFVRYKQSAQGVLFVIFSNGDAYFYPLNDQTKGDYVSGNKMPLTKEAPSKKKSSTNLGTDLKSFCFFLCFIFLSSNFKLIFKNIKFRLYNSKDFSVIISPQIQFVLLIHWN